MSSAGFPVAAFSGLAATPSASTNFYSRSSTVEVLLYRPDAKDPLKPAEFRSDVGLHPSSLN